MVGNLLKIRERIGWGAGEMPPALLPAQPEGSGPVDCLGVPLAEGGVGVLICESPRQGPRCVALTPLGGVAAGLIWTLPHSCPWPRGLWSPGAKGQTPYWGHFNGGGVFLSFTFFFFLLIMEMFGPCPPPVSLVLAPPICPDRSQSYREIFAL